MKDETDRYYQQKKDRVYYGGSGIVRMFIAITFLIAGAMEPSYEPIHRVLAIAFGLYVGFFGVRAFINEKS